uniref:Reverse transcriptase domain-containing protein n=1 Tax=Tanacetum cinerariifolium TaxID=118510 RepID=A0A6L2JIC2_TANCI|nr:reverse transcriptase domain-containing protein [Tanacetum cinerariifolium]
MFRNIHPLSGSPTPSSDHVVVSLSPSLTPFGDIGFLLEETDAFLALDDSIPPEIDNGIYDSEGDIIILEILLNDDLAKDLPPKELKNNETKTTKSSIEEPPELELKHLPPHLEYAFLEGTSKLPMIIAKDLKREENDQLIKRRVNPKIHEVIKAEVIKLLDVRLINSISNSPCVSLVHVIPKKGGMAVVTNDNNELILTRLVTGWRVCGNEFYCFLDGSSRYFQIPIDPQDQEKTTFTCPYGTFAYRRMPFGLCNAPGTFQRCIVEIFHDMIEKTIEVIMDDYSKCDTMVKEGIVLGHKISKNGIEVDRAKVDVIAKIPPPMNVKGIRSFLGAENLAADHLSILENPYKGDLVETKMNDNFPHESLNMIALNDDNEPLWFADIANYLMGNVLIKGMSSQQKKKIFKDIRHYFWDDPNLFRISVDQIIRLCVDAKEVMNILEACHHGPLEDIMALTTSPRKFLILVSFGPLYIVMLMTWSNTVTHVNVKEKSHKGTKCPRILSKFVRSLTYGASTLWDHSRLHEGTNIYSWLSIMFPNGLKPKPYPQMTPE